jgi:hypothetical protein
MYDGDVTEDEGVGKRMTIHEAGVVVTIDENNRKVPATWRKLQCPNT